MFSKGLTGGTLPLGITTCTEEIYNAFIQTIKQKHYFTDILLRQALWLVQQHLPVWILLLKDTQRNIERIVNQHKEFGEALKSIQK